jgi:hypothetical protein
MNSNYNISSLPFYQLGYKGPILKVVNLSTNSLLEAGYLGTDKVLPSPTTDTAGFHTGCPTGTLATVDWVNLFVSAAKLDKDTNISTLMTKSEEGIFLGNGLKTETLTTAMIGQTYTATCADLTMLVNCAKLDTIDGGDPVFAKRSNL